MLPMSESQDSNVVSFPIQNSNDLDSLSSHELLYEAKISWIRVINMAIAGTYKLTDKNKQSIRRLNELAAELGYIPLLDYDFENL